MCKKCLFLLICPHFSMVFSLKQWVWHKDFPILLKLAGLNWLKLKNLRWNTASDPAKYWCVLNFSCKRNHFYLFFFLIVNSGNEGSLIWCSQQVKQIIIDESSSWLSPKHLSFFLHRGPAWRVGCLEAGVNSNHCTLWDMMSCISLSNRRNQN